METLKGFVLAIIVMAVVTCAIAPGQPTVNNVSAPIGLDETDCP